MGMACRAVTTLRGVTGTHGQIDRYTDLKTQQQYREVRSKEYHDRLQHHLIPEGNRLAWDWHLEHCLAAAHNTKANMACIAANVPRGHFLAWAPKCPDL